MKQFSLILCLSLLPLISCKSETDTKSITFLNYVRDEKYDKAKSLVYPGLEKTYGKEGLDFRLNIAHELLVKYGIPPHDKWEIKYDTSKEKGAFRMIEITIPVYRAHDSMNESDLEYGDVILDYIYKNQFFGDAIFAFDTHIKKVKKKKGFY